ncbi:MAG: hypothetical protein O4861_20905 [Trichodesmium sp. St16_bin4-tuft]|nr:hypothetical protein [Trichodesmium sp. St5_bin8]MDE5078644.1 hypothetical protein [Trichodesmium sp. St2_bin6]MDE5100657.1 hypothetical protein [Trichodesmium sp. St16_bin4-tuft]MDE5105363.1 hypothetical protein [Trichodesmium sp. St19_bin2]
MSQSSLTTLEFESQTKWKIEELHARIKQLTGLGRMQGVWGE